VRGLSCSVYFVLLDLHGSNWALTTCFIVGSERQSERILAKSAARIVGTLVGVMASFTLVNAFAQEGVLFICCFGAWLSICAYFSHYQRGQLGLCLGSLWIHHRHRRGSCGIGAEPGVQCNYEQSEKRHHWRCLHGCSQHDCFSGDRQSIFDKTSAGDRCRNCPDYCQLACL